MDQIGKGPPVPSTVKGTKDPPPSTSKDAPKSQAPPPNTGEGAKGPPPPSTSKDASKSQPPPPNTGKGTKGPPPPSTSKDAPKSQSPPSTTRKGNKDPPQPSTSKGAPKSQAPPLNTGKGAKDPPQPGTSKGAPKAQASLPNAGKGTKGPPPPPRTSKGAPKAQAPPPKPSPLDDEMMAKLLVENSQYTIACEDVEGELGTYTGPTVECSRCEKSIREDMWLTHWQAHSTEIEPRLFLGARRNLENIEEILKRTKISHVLNVATEGSSLLPELVGKIEITSMPLEDLPTQQLDGVLRPISAFMHQVLANEENCLLVCCTQGISRSVTVLLAFLMEYRGLSLKNAYDLLKELRPIIDPRPEFLDFLGELEMRLHNVQAPSLLSSDVVGDRKKLDVDTAPLVPTIDKMLQELENIRKGNRWQLTDLNREFRFVDWNLQFSLVSKIRDVAHKDLFATIAGYQFISTYPANAPELDAVDAHIRQQCEELNISTPLWFGRVQTIWRNVFGAASSKQWQASIGPKVLAKKFAQLFENRSEDTFAEKVAGVIKLACMKAPFERPSIHSDAQAERFALGFLEVYGEDSEKWKQLNEARDISDDNMEDVSAFWMQVFSNYQEPKVNFQVQKVDKKTCEKCSAIYTGETCHCLKRPEKEVDVFAELRHLQRRSIHGIEWSEIVEVRQVHGSSGTNGVFMAVFTDTVVAIKILTVEDLCAECVFNALNVRVSRARVVSLTHDSEEYFAFFEAVKSANRDVGDPLIPLLMTSLQTNDAFGVIEVHSLRSLPGPFGLVQAPKPHEPLFYTMGELAVGDCLTNNMDRFPLGSLWQNVGNLSNCVVTRNRIIGIDQAIRPIVSAAGRIAYMDRLRSLFALSRNEFCVFVKEKLVQVFQEDCGVEVGDSHLQAFTDGFFDTRAKLYSIQWSEVLTQMETSVSIFQVSPTDILAAQQTEKIQRATKFLQSTIATVSPNEAEKKRFRCCFLEW